MLRLDWGNPKISLAELETFLSSYLTTQYDGLNQNGNYLFIITYSPLSPTQEDCILNYVASLNGAPTQTLAQPFASKVLSNGKKLYKREHGIQSDVIVGTNTILFTIPYAWVKIIGLEIMYGENLDTIDLMVLDSSTGTYSTIPNYQLNQFGFSVNVSAGVYEEENSYDADLYMGMQLKIVYHSQSNKRIGINFNLSEVK